MSETFRHATMASCIGFVAFCGLTAGARASSFALREESAEGLGNANAGETAKADDASTAFYNPAGMTHLDRSEVDANVTWIQPDVLFSGSNSSPLGGNVAGITSGNEVKPSAIGSLMGVWNASPNWRFGVSVAVPYGERSEYKEDWVGRYQALATDVTDIEFSPTVAYRVNDHLSIGGGPRIDDLQARLTSAVNVRAIGLGVAQQIGAGAQQAAAGAQKAAAAAQAAAMAGDTAQAATLAAQANTLASQASALGGQAASLGALAGTWGDGIGKVEGSDIGVGYTLGALYELDSATRLGITYRSRIYHNLGTDVGYQVPGTIALAGPAFAANFAAQPVTAKLVLPDSLSIGFVHDIDRRWTVLSDFQWTDWSLFRQLNVVNASGTPVISLPQLSRNTMFVSLGADYKLTDQWTVRAGTAYDQTPVKDGYRSPNLPDTDRVWASFGVSYTVSANTAVHVGYAHLFNVGNVPIHYASIAPAAGVLAGSYDDSVDIFSAGVAVKF